jgi:hypothetical protein
MGRAASESVSGSDTRRTSNRSGPLGGPLVRGLISHLKHTSGGPGTTLDVLSRREDATFFPIGSPLTLFGGGGLEGRGGSRERPF